MHKLTSRGLASFALAGLLVTAPLASTASFADDAPVIDAPAAEAPVVVEAPAAEAPIAEEPATDAPPTESAPAVVEDVAPIETTAALVVDAPTSNAVQAAPAAADQYAVSNVRGSYNFATGRVTVTWDAPLTAPDHYDYCWRILSGIVPEGEPSAFCNSSLSASATSYSFAASRSSTVSVDNYAAAANGSLYFANDQSGFSTFQIPATPPPAAPTELVATRLPAVDGFHLSWNAPESENPVDHYTITIARDDITFTVTSATTSYDLTGIDMGDYSFTVRSMSANGQVSDTAAETSAQLTPISPTVVRNLVLTLVGGELSARWDAPDYDGGAAIQGYEIDLYDGDEYLGEDVVDGDSTTWTFDGEAEYGDDYTITVVALGGNGDPSDSVTSNTVQRDDSPFLAPVAHVTADGYKTPQIYLTWDLDDAERSAAISYTVRLYDADGTVVQQAVIGGGYTGWTFFGLANDTSYSASVVVDNSAGSSPESARAEVRTLGPVPPAPELGFVQENPQGVTAALSGDVVTAFIPGAEVGDDVFGYAFSTPTALGWAKVQAGGFASWSIAGKGLATGQTHTLAVLDAFGHTIGSAAFAVPAVATATPVATAVAAVSSSAALANTGSDPSGLLTGAAIMLAVGILVTVRRRVRA